MTTITSNTSDTHNSNHEKRKFIMLTMACVFLIIAFAFYFYWLGWGRYAEFTDDAYVAGNIVQLMPQVEGTVNAVNTDDTRLVIAGQPLVKLNDDDAQVALQQATAKLAQTVRQIRQYYETAEQAKATLELRKVGLDKAQQDFKRRSGLLAKHAISREELQHFNTATLAAKAQYDLAEHRLAAALALVDHSHLYQHPLVEQAKASFRAAYLNLQRTTIMAPITGYVAKRSVQLGQQVKPGTPLLTIIPLDQIWVDANYKESQLERIRIGQPIRFTADAYNHFEYHGKVIGLSAGTGSAFALLPPQNATGNWIKIVQRLPVRIQIDPTEFKVHPLQIGLSVGVTVDTHNLQGSRLATQLEQPISYTTPIFNNQLAPADALIQRIIEANASTDMTIGS